MRSTNRMFQMDAHTLSSRLTEVRVNAVDAQKRLLQAAGTTYVYTNAGDLASKLDASGTTTFNHDPLGNLLAVRLPNGTQIDYDEFGNVVSDSNPGFQPFGFAGRIYDSQTGLVRFGVREYDPAVGRWTTPDSRRFAGSQTGYDYVNNDPINFVDPRGERPLTTNEKGKLNNYFGNNLDVDSINLGSTTFNDRAWSPYGSQIHIPDSYFKDGDPSKEVNLSDPYTVGVFAHEALHVWQREQGEWVTTKAALLQVLDTLGIKDAYEYDESITDPDKLLEAFKDANVEGQGQMFQDFVEAMEAGDDASRFSKLGCFVAGGS